MLSKIAYFSIISLGWTGLVFAQALKNPLKGSNTFGEVIVNLARAITFIGVPVAGIFIIYSGFLFVTARGSDEQITKAKTTLFYTIIGTVLIIGAWAIASALNDFAQKL